MLATGKYELTEPILVQSLMKPAEVLTITFAQCRNISSGIARLSQTAHSIAQAQYLLVALPIALM